jgi:hypothetical protein
VWLAAEPQTETLRHSADRQAASQAGHLSHTTAGRQAGAIPLDAQGSTGRLQPPAQASQPQANEAV